MPLTRTMRKGCFVLLIAVALAGCGVSSSFSVSKKYSPQELQKDFDVYRSLMEEVHPGLYWYTSQDSMNYYFEEGKKQLSDSLTEYQFRKILAYVTAKINCGHTSVRSSKKYSRADTARNKLFPLSMKAWDDTVVVSSNLNRRDTVLKRGTVIQKINGRPVEKLIDTMFNYIPADGNNRTYKYQSISNRGSFGGLFTMLYGLSPAYSVEYLDSLGQVHSINIPVYDPAADTATRSLLRRIASVPTPSARERRQNRLASTRQLRIDTVNRTAFIELNSFGRGYHLKRFYRQSFQSLKEYSIPYLIIDVRSNGGGSVSNSTSLSRYIAKQPFKIADSLYAITKKAANGRYIQNHFWNRLFITFFAKRRPGGNYHFGYFERHFFKPKEKDRFDGNVYILTGGNSFSATTLFVHAIKDQSNVVVVGEETGGAAYGNTAWLIPDVILPETKIRFRLPLFRLVMNKNTPKDGKGIQPEVESKPTVEAIKRNKDFKLDTVLELIRADKEKK